MLKVKNLRKSFGQLIALDSLTFNLKEGEIMGLIGQNGSGKTTSFRLILNLLYPDEGEINWTYPEFKENNFDSIGYLPEERGLNQKATVEEQILYFAELRGQKRQDVKPLIDDWMAKFEVKGKKTDKIKHLSKGNQQKVQLITTLIHEPKLIILDEPFSGLDPVNAGLLAKGIKEASDRGAAIIFSSHNMANVQELCQKLVMLKQGRQVLSGSINDIRESFGRRQLEIESPLNQSDLLSFNGVEKVTAISKNRFLVHLSDPEVAKTIFQRVSKESYIPHFSHSPLSLEDIFKEVVGDSDA